MNIPKISIVIPVYNVESYLRQCIESVLSQTYQNYEIILIDDGSSDCSSGICDEYVMKDGRLSVWHQSNAGSSAARNEGLIHSTGDYLFFMDSDDWIDNNHLSNLVKIIQSEKTDIVICAYCKENKDKKHYCPNKPTGYEKEELINNILSGVIHAGLWNKLVKMDIVKDNKLRFPKYNFYEDMYFSTSLVFYTTRWIYYPEATYHYRVNSTSLTYSNDYDKRIRMYKEFESNMNDLFDHFNLWDNEEMINNLYYRINFNKLRLLELPFTYQVKEILATSFPESVSHFKINGVTSLLDYIALKYNKSFLRKIRIKISDICRSFK